jgi:HSP20 family protein
MKNYNLYDSGCSVYPGDYVPLLKAEEMQDELKFFNEGEMTFPSANITELADTYKVELAVPGAKREDFLIQADENILSVSVVHKQLVQRNEEIFQLHEFDYNCCKRYIVLPDDAGAEFVSAEYKAGILCLYVPKVKEPVKNLHTTIVVY